MFPADPILIDVSLSNGESWRGGRPEGRKPHPFVEKMSTTRRVQKWSTTPFKQENSQLHEGLILEGRIRNFFRRLYLSILAARSGTRGERGACPTF